MRFPLLGAKKFAIIALAVPACLAAGAPPSPPPPRELPATVRGELGRAMDELLRRTAAFGFGGQVVVENDGQLVLHGAYGYADRSERRPMRTDTKIGIASLSKQLTAAAVLALREEGRLELEDPLSRFLPELSAETGRLTLHQLLSHTAGLRGGDVAGDDFEIPGRQELLRRIDATPPAGPPGERWRYANAGYNLLAAVVEEVTGAPYEDYVLARIFRPAGMERTGFWHRPRPVPEEVAHAYRAWMDQGSPASWPRNWRVYGAGDVLSTAADLFRWEVALRKGRVLSEESVALLRRPHAAVGDTGDAYGYGWFLHPEEGGRTVIEHGGDWLGGYNAFHYVDPGRRLVVIVLSNATDASGMWLRQAVQKSLIDLADGKPFSLPPAVRPDEEVPAALLGSHRVSGSRGVLHLFHDGAHAWLAAEGQEAANLLLAAEGEVAAGLTTASRRSGRLLAGLLACSGTAFEEALGEEGAPFLEEYETDWADLVARYGDLEAYEVLGAAPRGRSAEAQARLSFARGEISYSLLWAERGARRLHGTLVRDRPASPMPFPAAYTVGVGEDGDLVAYDIFRERGVRLTAGEDGRLVLRPPDGGTPVEAWAAGSLLPAASGWERAWRRPSSRAAPGRPGRGGC